MIERRSCRWWSTPVLPTKAVCAGRGSVPHTTDHIGYNLLRLHGKAAEIDDHALVTEATWMFSATRPTAVRKAVPIVRFLNWSNLKLKKVQFGSHSIGKASAPDPTRSVSSSRSKLLVIPGLPDLHHSWMPVRQRLHGMQDAVGARLRKIVSFYAVENKASRQAGSKDKERMPIRLQHVAPQQRCGQENYGMPDLLSWGRGVTDRLRRAVQQNASIRPLRSRC